MQRKIFLMRPLGSHASPLLSHTLFGAACWAMATLGVDVGAILEKFTPGPRFAFSAAYPYVYTRDGTPILLLPRPPLRVSPNAIEADTDKLIKEKVGLAKKLQKTVYISSGIAQHLRSGAWNVDTLFHRAVQRQVKIFNSTLWLQEELGKFRKHQKPKTLWKQAVIQRNSVDRLAGATVEGILFQQGETFYNTRYVGVWFAVWADDALWSEVQGALRFMADTGLGGKRSVGKGHFALEAQAPWDKFFPTSPQPVSFLNLSHYIPGVKEQVKPLTYTLDVIRQKAENRYPQGEQRVYIATLRAFMPGSLFTSEKRAETLYGRLLPLGATDDHTVYYSGLTLPLWGAWEV